MLAARCSCNALSQFASLHQSPVQYSAPALISPHYTLSTCCMHTPTPRYHHFITHIYVKRREMKANCFSLPFLQKSNYTCVCYGFQFLVLLVFPLRDRAGVNILGLVWGEGIVRWCGCRGGYCLVVWVAGDGIVWCCQGVVLILIWRLVPVPLITNGWYWHSLQGGQAQTQYISTSVRREDRGQSASQGLADTEIQNSVGNFLVLSASPTICSWWFDEEQRYFP